jgi:hypothetical protein
MDGSMNRNRLWRVTTQMEVTGAHVKDMGARVGVSRGMVQVTLRCFRWLSPFLKLV